MKPRLAMIMVPLLAMQAADADVFARARAHAQRFDAAASACDRLLHAWLKQADPRTLLLPDRIPGGLRGLKPGDRSRLYTPHNSGADLYPYLVLTAQLTAPEIFRGRMLEMLRNEVRYTTTAYGLPANLELATGELGQASLFGAGEYAKDGLLAITEYLGASPWFYRMADMVADAMARAPVDSRFGRLPASDAELNGDYLQALVRLATMTGDPRYLEWARRIGDAYVEEALPGNHGLPGMTWDFTAHTGDRRVKLRDHGNEIVAGLALLYAVEDAQRAPRAARYRPAIEKMLDRILASANPDGMLFNSIDAETLAPLDQKLSDNWGYVYGAVYTFYQRTGETKYRDTVRKALRNLPKYRNHNWEPAGDAPLGSFDGYADSIESALYLVNREPVSEALDWIETETRVMMAMQKPDGHVENWYGEGNFNRTLLLYLDYQSQGCRPERWTPGLGLGAVRQGGRLYLSLTRDATVRFDSARHRRMLHFDRNYVRLNEFPEWFTVDENTLYALRRGDSAEIFLGSELIAGVRMAAGDWMVEAAARHDR